MSERYNSLTSLFSAQKDVIYRDSLGELQATLGSLHAGTDPGFLEQMHDLEEARDSELVTLYLNQEFLLSRAEKEYKRDVAAAMEEYENMARSVREHLLNRLESQRRKLREDRELLDIANDHSLLLSVSGYQAPPDSPGGGSSGAGSGAGVMGSVGERRKNLRRRGDLIPTTAAAEASGLLITKKRKRNERGGASSGVAVAGDKDEIAAFWSDREALPFGHSARNEGSKNGPGANSGSNGGSVTGRHREKALGGLIGLKSEEIADDIAILRKRRKRK